ncbi:MAG: MFS transporter [Acidimicrobiales bacterium]
MPTVTSTSEVGPAGLAALRLPRAGLVAEHANGDDTFRLDVGPVHRWERSLHVVDVPGSRCRVTENVSYRLAIPLWWPLFVVPIRVLLRREHKALAAATTIDPAATHAPITQPFWAPADRFDARASTVLALVCALSLVTGYVGTAITQTVTYAASEFHRDTGAQGVTLAVVRIGALLALVLAAASDRRGRRRVLVVSLYAACLTAALGAASPNLLGLGVTQLVAQGFASAATLLIAVLVAEEVPAGSRAWSVSILAMSTALGAGMCIWVLPVADVGVKGWRIIYLVPLLGIPLVAWGSRHLPESKRYLAHQAAAGTSILAVASPVSVGSPMAAGAPHITAAAQEHGADPPPARDGSFATLAARAHRRRFILLAIGAFGLALFIAPMFQLQNDFLRHERGYSAARISLYTLVTSTPGGLGILLGGWLADARGRRPVAAFGIVAGSLLAVATLFSYGAVLWGLSIFAAVASASAVPAMAVFGPELFPTALRGRINGLLQIVAVVGSSIGLLLAGWLTDVFHRFGSAMALLAVGPALVAVLVVLAYPETSGQSLEDLNPEDR